MEKKMNKTIPDAEFYLRTLYETAEKEKEFSPNRCRRNNRYRWAAPTTRKTILEGPRTDLQALRWQHIHREETQRKHRLRIETPCTK